MTSGKVTVTDGAVIAWQRDGKEGAPVLVFSNSLGTTHTMWDQQITGLASRFSILRYDARGHGLSDAPVGAYGLDRLGRDVIDLLDKLGIERVHFCGVSLGGMTGQWLGIHASERINRLILANTAAHMGPPSSWQTRIDTLLAEGMPAIASAVLERWLTPQFLALNLKEIATLQRELLACSPQGYAGCCAAIRDMDMRQTVGTIPCPTLVINGLRDPATPPNMGEFIAQHINDARVVVLDAAHLSNIERPAEFNSAVLEFLS